MSDFPTVREQVRETLRCLLDARNNDRVLYVELVARFYGVASTKTLAAWVDAECPDYESVRRSRCEIQAAGEFLPTDPKVIAARRKKQGDMREALGYERESGADVRAAARADVTTRTRGGVLFDAGSPSDAHCKLRGRREWLARCDCGRTSRLVPSRDEKRVALRSRRACTVCDHRRREKPALCVSCGTTDRKRFAKSKSRCATCDRRHHRNGSCSCGAAFVGGPSSHKRRCPRGCPTVSS